MQNINQELSTACENITIPLYYRTPLRALSDRDCLIWLTVKESVPAQLRFASAANMTQELLLNTFGQLAHIHVNYTEGDWKLIYENQQFVQDEVLSNKS